MDESCVACGHFARTTLYIVSISGEGGGRGLVKRLQGVRGWMLELDEDEVEELVDKEEEDGEDEGEK